MSWVNSKAFIGIFSRTAGSTCEFWVPVNITFGLKKPTLFNGKRLTALPVGLGALAGLEELCLWGSTGRTALPAGLGRLRNLEELDLHDLDRVEVELQPDAPGWPTSTTSSGGRACPRCWRTSHRRGNRRRRRHSGG
jgi:hypothetical protein